MPTCPHCAAELAPDATLCNACGYLLSRDRGLEGGLLNPPMETRGVFALPLSVFGFAICLTAVFLEFSVFTVALGFSGFLMFAVGGLTHLMRRPALNRRTRSISLD
jgi:hypothetical protein